MKSKGLGGFNRKWGAIILLLAVIFISLALSQSRFFISYASASSPKFAVYEGLESLPTNKDDCDKMEGYTWLEDKNICQKSITGTNTTSTVTPGTSTSSTVTPGTSTSSTVYAPSPN
jgi:hypothetical protein